MTDPTADTSVRSLAGQAEEQLLNSFFILYKTSRILDAGNEVFKNQLETFMNCLRTVARESGEVAVKTISGHYFVNDRMVRFNDQGLSGAAGVVSEWHRLGIGGIRFENNISSENVHRFFKFITATKPDDTNIEKLANKLASHGLSQVELLSARVVRAASPEMTEEIRRQCRRMARTTFFKAMSVVQEAIAGTGEGREINISKTRRVVHTLIDQIVRDESSLIELTAIRDHDDYTYAHSTNVAVYALTLGVRLGLDRARLSQLGFAAMFHDIGKVKLPKDIISKPDAFDEDDWIQMQRHPMLGAKTLLRNMKLDVHTARAARAAFEHHINNDLTGYPMLHYKKRTPNLFSNVISIVDTFDALTSGRVYLKNNLPPDIVFKKMRFQMKVKFNPFLLQLFNDIIGMYPAGTMVLLTSNEIALILTNNEQDKARPYVKIVGNEQGILPEPIWFDLSLPENHDRSIVRQIDPARYGLSIRDFVLGD